MHKQEAHFDESGAAPSIPVDSIAIVGMAGRFPGAATVDAFWQNLRNGVETITHFTKEELQSAGVDPGLVDAPNFVGAYGALDDVEGFDAAFFGIPPREAEIMDPQHRLFLECAWQALEHASYDSEQYDGTIGVYAGVGVDTYAINNLFSNRDLLAAVSTLQASIRNRTDHVTTQVAYKLNLRGPSITVQTACSTSLVAVHLACQSLLNGECDMTLAGGVSISVPQKNGYLYTEGGIFSPDGHCRAFDAQAQGTVGGSGVGIVVLKRLEDALADGDTIHAIIRGSAINNDGSRKVGYTAPGVDGQAAVITEALAVADVDPATISYVETHGTGTALGDPIEVEALTRAYRTYTDRRGYCALGAVKSNVGHLDTAAGVTGLLKTVLALKHRELPPSLHYTAPNPRINFADSPFYVNNQLTAWSPNGAPLRAGVSSFGIGGTNAHVVLEEWVPAETSQESRSQQTGANIASDGCDGSRPWHLLTLSAKTSHALEEATAQLSTYLTEHPEVDLADVAYTLHVGRRAFGHRRAIVCRDGSAADALQELDPQYVFTGVHEPKRRPVVFMFPGQGAQYVNMGRDLYAAEPRFRAEIDRCCDLLQPHLGLDLRTLLFPPAGAEEAATNTLTQTWITQPALFAVEYALAQLWMGWGVVPEAMIGHSIGEYVAATLAGVFSLEDALALVALRGQLMQDLPGGSMLVVTLPEKEVLAHLTGDLALAAVNGQALCVVSGPHEAVDQLEQTLGAQNIGTRRLHTSHAFHSPMMNPILDTFTEAVARLERKAPQIPYLSNITGDWITPAEATDPHYYADHMRQAVRFADGVHHLVQDPDWILLEVGPGRTLMTIARWHPGRAAGQIVLTSLPHATTEEIESDVAFLQTTLGRLWLAGVAINWDSHAAHERRQRVPLPTYPFERKRYWIDPPKAGTDSAMATGSLHKRPNKDEWFYTPSWTRTPARWLDAAQLGAQPQRWLLFVNDSELSKQVAERLQALRQEVICVRMGQRFAQHEIADYTIHPQQSADYMALFEELQNQGQLPTKILHLWNLQQNPLQPLRRVTRQPSSVDQALDALSTVEDVTEIDLSFYSLLYLAQALGTTQSDPDSQPIAIGVVTGNMQEVWGGEAIYPEQATVIGPCRAMAKEYPNVTCRVIDTVESTLGSVEVTDPRLIDHLITELTETTDEAAELMVAYRGQHRWRQDFNRVQLPMPTGPTPRLRPRGIYLITGGLGGIGLTLAADLAKRVQARLVLIGRSPFPPEAEWAEWLALHAEDEPVSRKIRQLQAMVKEGAEVLVLQADVADIAQMRAVMRATAERFGAINGVIHAAGVAGGGLMQLKGADQAAAVLDPKVKGTLVLEKLFQGNTLDFFVLCSSRSSILGGFGQADYCAANAFLDAFAHAKAARDGSFTIAVNWSGWQEVGMRVNTLAQIGLAANGNEPVQPTPDRALTPLRTGPHPLLQQVVRETPTLTEYRTAFSVVDHWVLDDHRIVKKAVIPGVTYPEMARAALEQVAGDREIEIRDIFFLAAVGVRDDEVREVRTIVERLANPEQEGADFAFRMSVRQGDGGTEWTEHVFGKAALLEPNPPVHHEIDALIARCTKRTVVATDEPLTHEDLGPRWQNLRRAYIGENEMVAVLELAEEFSADFEHFKLHCGLLDRTNGAAKIYLAGEGLYMPMGYRRILIKAPLPRKVYAYHRFDAAKDPTRETITFDVILMDENGLELVEIEAFSQKRVNVLASPIRQISGSQTSGASAPVPATATSPTATSATATSPTETSAVMAGSAGPTVASPSAPAATGILPQEGVDLFQRIMASRGLAQVIVSPNDLHASIRLANAARPAQSMEEIEKIEISRPTHARPDLSTDYVEPRNALEAEIASIWQTILGIEQIGVHDNFFELGGDSVAGIQMVAKFNQGGHQLSPQQLFQHQTIAELAGVLGAASGDAPDGATAAEAPVEEFALADLDEEELSGILARY